MPPISYILGISASQLGYKRLGTNLDETILSTLEALE
jgi:hypothetical protein